MMVRPDSINRHRAALIAGKGVSPGVSPIPNGAGWRLVLWKWLRFSAWLRCHMIIISDTLTQNNSVYEIIVYLWLKRWVAWFYIHFSSAAARFDGWGPYPVCLMWCCSHPWKLSRVPASVLDTATLESDSHLDKSGIVGNPVLVCADYSS